MELYSKLTQSNINDDFYEELWGFQAKNCIVGCLILSISHWYVFKIEIDVDIADTEADDVDEGSGSGMGSGDWYFDY